MTTDQLLITIVVATLAASLAAYVAGRAALARTDGLEQLVVRERELAEQRLAEAAASREQLVEQFKAVSVDVLDANGRRFLELAKEQLATERLKGASDLEQRQQAISELVKPVTTKLQEVDQRITMFDQERQRSAGMLAGQIKALQQSGEQLRMGATALTRALRQPQGRGQWGELQLRNVVELAGLNEHCSDFTTQHHLVGEDERRLRPDMVVNMPSGRCVVIDSKVPLDAFLDAMESADDDAAEPHLARHAEQVRTHVSQLSKKDYSTWLDGALPDMVVLFLPAEHLFAAAVRQHPRLIEDAFDKRVVIASPTTLLTLLHAIAIGWKEERLAENAAQIADLGRELHRRVGVMAGHFDKLGRSLEGAMKSYNATVGSLETSILPQARRFEKLDARSTKDVQLLDERTVEVRQLQARELVAELDGADEESHDEQVA